MNDEPSLPIAADPPSAAARCVRVSAAVVIHEGQLLLTQRPPGGELGLQWELPGGKIEPGETPEHALAREVHEELGVRATPFEVLAVSRHDYPHGLEVELVFVRCTLDSFEFTPSAAVHAVRWVAPAAVDLESVLAGDRGFLKRLAAGSR
jgi:mutator protein MutT